MTIDELIDILADANGAGQVEVNVIRVPGIGEVYGCLVDSVDTSDTEAGGPVVITVVAP